MTRSRMCGLYLRLTVLVALPVCVGYSGLKAQEVLTDSQLLELSRVKYESGDWLNASVYMYALIQRNSPLVRARPFLLSELEQGQQFAFLKVQETCRIAADCQKENRGPSVVLREIKLPPKIDWPKQRQH